MTKLKPPSPQNKERRLAFMLAHPEWPNAQAEIERLRPTVKPSLKKSEVKLLSVEEPKKKSIIDWIKKGFK